MLAGLFFAGRAAAEVDLNGLWRVGIHVAQPSPTGAADACAVTVTHDGSALSFSGPCEGTAGSMTATATVDPVSGRIAGSGSVAGCATLQIDGIALASDRFTAWLECTAPPAAGMLNASRCGNGELDAGETCDDGNVLDGDCCTAACLRAAAGSACRDDGSACTTDTCDAAGHCQHLARTGTCDDGNRCTVDDICADGLCAGTALADDTPCDDGNACTAGDRCVGGECVTTPVTCSPCEACTVEQGCVPFASTGCKEAATGGLDLRRRASDTLVWRWQRGEATDVADFGDPTADTDYELCVYDQATATGATRLVAAARAPAGLGWQSAPGGFGYRNDGQQPGGTQRIRLKSGADRTSRILVRGRGRELGLASLETTDAPLTVQLKARRGEALQCWSTVYAQHAAKPTALEAERRRPRGETRPNIIVVYLDDTRSDGIDQMPALADLAANGVTFTNSFVASPLCAPARASMLTGLHTSHHGVRTLGGAEDFRRRGADRQTIATWLQAAGYMTGMFGKYLNGYGNGPESRQGPGGGAYVPPGWTRWRGMTSPESFGGVRGSTYRVVDEHGGVTVYDGHADDSQYSTDVLAAQMRDFIGDAARQRRPFLAVWTPCASHADLATFVPEPAARHHLFFRDLPAWRPPSFGEPDIGDKPSFMRALAVASPNVEALADRIRRSAYETLLSVDEQLRILLADLARLGIDHDTVILVASDNGSGWGEHRLYFQAKQCPYEECLRVPLIVRDPRSGVSGRSYDAPVVNIDIAPTVAALAGVTPGIVTHGISLVPWIAGSPPPQSRTDLFIEHWRPTRDEVLRYVGQAADGDRLRLVYGDSRHHPRPSAVFEFDDGNGVESGAIAVPIGATDDDSFAALGIAINAAVPFTARFLNRVNNRLTISDTSPTGTGLTLIVERNQNNAVVHTPSNGDWFGVRDVTGGLTYVEHHTGEIELYDLTADPFQMDNKADDPAYAAVRANLALRLDELLP